MISCAPTGMPASGIAVSSIRSDERLSKAEWDCGSLQVSGDPVVLFGDLKPDYFASLLRRLPEPKEIR
ncbi:hypothetical protein [Haloferula helveola]